MITGATVNVLDFGAVGNGVADDTAAIQAAVTAATVLGKTVFIPAGVYLVTDTISIPSFTALYGEHQNMSGGGFGVDPKGTRILFQPTSAKSLFVASGTPPFGTFRSGYYIDGLSIEGNSTTSAGNSIYAIDVDMVTQSIFQNLAIKGFRTGIRCYGTINNRFQFIRIDTCFIQCILYDGNTATTDTWEQCYIRVAPIGVQTSGTSLGIKFSNCIFESLETYGVNLAKECFAWEFDACYAENIPTVANVNAAMFRVGYDGTTPSATIRLTVTGGYYGGSNAFASTANAGHWLDCDYSTGVSIASAFTTRFYYSIRTTANTTNGSIVVNGLNAIQQTGITVGTTGKIQGSLPNGLLNSGTLAQDTYNTLSNTNRITAYDGNGSYIRFDGAVIRINPGAGNAVYPVTDNTVNFGLGSNRWKVIYAGTGTINTSDGRDKQQVRDLSEAEKRVAIRCKSLLKAFKFNDAVAVKGDKARTHFGVLAQDVANTFSVEGLDASDYALFCYDEWEAKEEVLDNDGTVLTPAVIAGDRYGIRYEELLAFMISAL